jgi:U2 small nuclear ribonucleoprotein B''
MPKLRGTYEPPATATTSEATALQKSIFDAPPGATPGAIPSKPIENGIKPADSEGPHGVKRARDEEEDEQSDAPMDEDEDDAPMQEDSDSD